MPNPRGLTAALRLRHAMDDLRLALAHDALTVESLELQALEDAADRAVDLLTSTTGDRP